MVVRRAMAFVGGLQGAVRAQAPRGHKAAFCKVKAKTLEFVSQLYRKQQVTRCLIELFYQKLCNKWETSSNGQSNETNQLGTRVSHQTLDTCPASICVEGSQHEQKSQRQTPMVTCLRLL
eukprot:5328399-Amphidinium_carterae.2